MNTQKLKDALIEMKHQRALLEAAIKNIEGVLATLGDVSPTESTPSNKKTYDEGSYIDLGQRILEEYGKPMHIVEIAKRISELKGKSIPRASVESSFVRHIKIFGDKARIVKTRPAFFGLPLWKTLFSTVQRDSAA